MKSYGVEPKGYFNAHWMAPFRSATTRPAPFLGVDHDVRAPRG